ncbi:P-loop NTPase fold protein [Micromonospora arida]|uniref:KAP family P-loop NTPase fold protein n=1 Tax=Micromonospora arida TaxID=2203715 RepID=UPI003CEDEDA9
MSRTWSDEPIGSGDEDLLDRSRFALRVADVIQEAGSAGPSTVFGLVGPWGGGKTSLINLVEKELPPPWMVVRFTPWAASSVADLLAEFFATIASALPPESRAAKAREALLACAKVAAPAALRLLPVAGEPAADVASAIGGRFGQDKPWSMRFEQACQQLRELGIPVLVVADDIDRLDAAELAALLKAVRLLGRFPGVHYLLAYDQATVIDVLSSSATVGSGTSRALEYLEKIVQYPMPIPPAQRSQLDRMLRTSLTGIVSEAGHEFDNYAADRFSLAYQDLMARTMTTVRSVQRYLAQGRAYLPLIGKGEIDVVDLLVLIHLRLHFPRLYDRLPSWRGDLTGQLDLAALASPETGAPDWPARIRDADVPAELAHPVYTVLRDLFPAMGGIQVTHGRPARGCRVGNPAYFDRYFALGIPQDDVPDSLVRQALLGVVTDEHALSRGEFASIVTGDDEDLALRALLKAGPLSLAMQPPATAQLAAFVATLVPRLSDAATLTGNVRSTAVSWLAALLQQATVDDPARLVATLVDAAGINAIVQATAVMTRDRRGRPPPGLRALLPHVAEHARGAVTENFAAGDAASRSDLIMTMVELIEEAGMSDMLTAEVRAGLNRGAWTLEDVASRFVTVHQLVGGSAGWEIDEFQPQRFSRLLRPELGATATVPADDLAPPEVDDDASGIDKHDVSWPNRRRVARRALERLGWS